MITAVPLSARYCQATYLSLAHAASFLSAPSPASKTSRVVFRELFLNGLTLLDLNKDGPIPLTMSHVAARQEVRDMVKALNLPGVGPVAESGIEQAG